MNSLWEVTLCLFCQLKESKGYYCCCFEMQEEVREIGICTCDMKLFLLTQKTDFASSYCYLQQVYHIDRKVLLVDCVQYYPGHWTYNLMRNICVCMCICSSKVPYFDFFNHLYCCRTDISRGMWDW